MLVSSLFLLLFVRQITVDYEISACLFSELAMLICRMFGVARSFPRDNCCCLSRAAEVHCKSARARSGLRRFYSSGH